MKYRPEIDGLRAVAVVPVILFHAGFEQFSGGFVGVDVFFVVSGYLITTILIEDIENNRFSIVNFYERRARRILPALFFVILACIPCAWMWMSPDLMKNFSQSLLAVSLFASNILFWLKSGYFDAAAEEKPLLHTWSLAVEEQYYVVFPIFLFLAWRFGKNKVCWMIVVLSAISLSLSEWGWRNEPTANFYLAPTRAWELFAGSIAAFIVQKHGVQSNNALSMLGMAGIVFAISAYDQTTPFPSLYALVPVVGVVLLVLFGDGQTLPAKLLSTKVFVGIGLISYSAYLWHQPLFSFARLRLLDPPPILMALLAVFSLVLAVASWKYIEMPFRRDSVVSRASFALFSCTIFLVFIVVGALGHSTIGFPNRVAGNHLPVDFYQFSYIDRAEKALECINSRSLVCSLRVNESTTYKILLVGDSHGLDFQRQFIEDAERRMISADQIIITGCGFVRTESRGCSARIEGLKKIVIENSYDEILFINALFGYARGGISEANWRSYGALLSTLSDNTKTLYIFEPRFHLKSIRPIQNILFKNEALNEVYYSEDQEVVNDFYQGLKEKHENLHLYNQAGVLLEVGGGDNFNAMNKAGYPLYRDSNHLTRFASNYLYDDFLKFKEKKILTP